MTNKEAIKSLNTLRESINGVFDYNCRNQCTALDMAIKALEIVNDFERAEIITGGRLNGRTHAYKCGLADGQRLANGEKLFNILPLEQQPTDKCKGCYYNDGEAHAECVVCDKGAQPTEAVEGTRDCKTCIHSDKGNCAYTEECHECMWESKYEQQPCEDCVSREAALDIINHILNFNGFNSDELLCLAYYRINELPPVTPERSDDKCTKI